MSFALLLVKQQIKTLY